MRNSTWMVLVLRDIILESFTVGDVLLKAVILQVVLLGGGGEEVPGCFIKGF